MADCDLCGLAKPTLCPVMVQVHTITHPEGTYRGLCLACLESCHLAFLEHFPPAKEEAPAKT